MLESKLTSELKSNEIANIQKVLLDLKNVNTLDNNEIIKLTIQIQNLEKSLGYRLDPDLPAYEYFLEFIEYQKALEQMLEFLLEEYLTMFTSFYQNQITNFLILSSLNTRVNLLFDLYDSLNQFLEQIIYLSDISHDIKSLGGKMGSLTSQNDYLKVNSIKKGDQLPFSFKDWPENITKDSVFIKGNLSKLRGFNDLLERISKYFDSGIYSMYFSKVKVLGKTIKEVERYVIYDRALKYFSEVNALDIDTIKNPEIKKICSDIKKASSLLKNLKARENVLLEQIISILNSKNNL